MKEIWGVLGFLDEVVAVSQVVNEGVQRSEGHWHGPGLERLGWMDEDFCFSLQWWRRRWRRQWRCAHPQSHHHQHHHYQQYFTRRKQALTTEGMRSTRRSQWSWGSLNRLFFFSPFDVSHIIIKWTCKKLHAQHLWKHVLMRTAQHLFTWNLF